MHMLIITKLLLFSSILLLLSYYCYIIVVIKYYRVLINDFTDELYVSLVRKKILNATGIYLLS